MLSSEPTWEGAELSPSTYTGIVSTYRITFVCLRYWGFSLFSILSFNFCR